MQLYLCEKPSQARDIARVLDAHNRSDGYLHNATVTVTWCFGHLLSMAAPEDYDPTLKHWRTEQLPFIPPAWRLVIRPEVRKQFRIIEKLLKQADAVVIATDADREGETIAREILEQCRWRGPVQRLWLSALDEASIHKALAALRPGDSTFPLYQAGLARARRLAGRHQHDPRLHADEPAAQRRALGGPGADADPASGCGARPGDRSFHAPPLVAGGCPLACGRLFLSGTVAAG